MREKRYMIKFFTRYKTFLAIMAVISSVILMLFYNALKPEEKLPVYQPASINYELVDQSLQHVKKFHEIGSFSLTNLKHFFVSSIPLIKIKLKSIHIKILLLFMLSQ